MTIQMPQGWETWIPRECEYWIREELGKTKRQDIVRWMRRFGYHPCDIRRCPNWRIDGECTCGDCDCEGEEPLCKHCIYKDQLN